MRLIIISLMLCGAVQGQTYLEKDAQKFVVAVAGGGDAMNGITVSAVHHFVIDLKGGLKDGANTYAANNWSTYVSIYPMVLSSATAHAFNLKVASSSTGNHGLTFVGSPTHSASGVQTNGSSSYINTNTTATNVGTTSSSGAAWYVSAAGTKNSGTYDWGALTSGGYATASMEGANTSSLRFFVGCGENNFCSVGSGVSAPYLMQGDNDGTTTRLWTAGSSVATLADNLSGTTMGTTNIYVGCENIPASEGGSSPSHYSPITVSTFMLRGHITTSAMTDEYNAIVAFNNILSR